MKTGWQVRRNGTPRHDGQRRWDLVYQLLLRWAVEREDGAHPVSSSHQEEHDGRCLVRTGVNQPPASDADD
jgi:hypothetical protein